jgi:hypothetical protein
MCERGINRKYVNYTTVRTGRAHHAGNTTLSASFQTLSARISFQTSEILETGCLKRVFSSSHVPACAETEPCQRLCLFATVCGHCLPHLTK